MKKCLCMSSAALLIGASRVKTGVALEQQSFFEYIMDSFIAIGDIKFDI